MDHPSPQRHTRRQTPVWVPQLIAIVLAGAVVTFAAVWTGPTASVTTAGDHDLRNGRTFIQDNLWSTAGEQLAVWVDGDGEARLGRRDRDGHNWEIVDLAGLAGNPLASPTEVDLHNVYVVAVDTLGYIHVAGNMHADPLRYVRTAEPGQLDAWVTPEIGGPVDRLTYPMFAALPDGTLLFFRRDGSSPDGDIHLDRLRAGSTDWEYLGIVLQGRNVPEGVYLHHVAVDPTTSMVHLLVVWRSGPTVGHQRDVSYLRSPDAGTTWTTSDGTPYTLPVRHSTVEVVVETAPQGSGLHNGGGMTVDGDGHPHAVISDRNGPHHLWHDGTDWQRAPLDHDLDSTRPSVARGPDGSVWVIGQVDGHIAYRRIHPNRGPLRSGPPAPRRYEPTYDTQAMQRFGTVEVLSIERGDDEPTVAVLDVGP